VLANSFLFLTIGLVLSLVVIPLSGFVIKRAFAACLIALYLLATAIGLLGEFHVITYPFIDTAPRDMSGCD
jgi:hypothetical protein